MKVNQIENNKPSKGLITLLIVALLLTLWTFFQSDDTKNSNGIELVDARPSSTARPRQADVTSAVSNSMAVNNLNPNSLKREPLASKPYNLFKVHSWVIVPPVKKVKPEPPPPPAAPPAPFTYMGRLENTPKDTYIFLVANGKLYTPRSGEKIDQQWRLDAEDANALRLTYLPLNLPQVLSKSARSAPMAVPVAEVNL